MKRCPVAVLLLLAACLGPPATPGARTATDGRDNTQASVHSALVGLAAWALGLDRQFLRLGYEPMSLNLAAPRRGLDAGLLGKDPLGLGSGDRGTGCRTSASWQVKTAIHVFEPLP